MQHKILIYAFSMYLEAANKITFFSQNENAQNQCGRERFWSNFDYLNRDLSNIQIRIRKYLISNIPNRRKPTLEKFDNDISNLSFLLDVSTDLPLNSLIDNIITTLPVIAENMKNLVENSLANTCEFTDSEYQLDMIVYEVVYAFQKFTLFIFDPFIIEHSLNDYKELTERNILNLKNTLVGFNDIKLVRAFIYYTNYSMAFFANYYIHTKKIGERENSPEKVGELLYTVLTYVSMHRTIVLNALNDIDQNVRPIEKLLSVVDKLKDTFSTSSDLIINIVKSRITEYEEEANELLYHATSFFRETLQNVMSINDIGSFKFIDCNV